MLYFRAFITGGIICAIGQLLIDRTKLTPARILVGFVVGGVFLTAIGVYQFIVDFGGAGATVPLFGFGYAMAKGVEAAVLERGFLGAISGGFAATSAGITAAVVLSLLAAVVRKR